MGQYYKPVSLDSKEWLLAHEYDNGLKLMEHSYVGNNLMDAVCNMLIPGGAWHKHRIVWTGDYADPDLFLDEPDKGTKDNDGRVYNLYRISKDRYKKIRPADDNLHKGYEWLLNHTKKQAVWIPKYLENTWEIHPLSLLTCSGNGRGSGDYRTKVEAGNLYVGTWAGDVISLEKKMPKGFEQIATNFKED